MKLIKGRAFDVIRIGENHKYSLLSFQLMKDMIVAIKNLECDPNKLGYLISSKNEHFSAGADMLEVLSNKQTPGFIMDYFNTLFDLKETIECSKKASYTLLDGFSIGGGLAVGLSSNTVIATDRTRMALSGASVGLGTFSSCKSRSSKTPFFDGLINATGIQLSAHELHEYFVNYIIDSNMKDEVLNMFLSAEKIEDIAFNAYLQEENIEPTKRALLTKAEVLQLNERISGINSFEELIQSRRDLIPENILEDVERSIKYNCPKSMIEIWNYFTKETPISDREMFMNRVQEEEYIIGFDHKLKKKYGTPQWHSSYLLNVL